MAHELALQTRSFEAGSDLSASQYCFVKLSSDQLALASAGGIDAIGILQDTPSAAGHTGCVAYGGTSKVVAGGTFSAGDRITCDASGNAVATGTDDTSLGTAVTDGADGVVASVLLDRG